MSIAVLSNTAQRWGDVLSKLTRQMRRLLDEKIECFVVDRNLPDSTERALETIVSGPFDKIILLGGDGTLNRVINALMQRDCLSRFSLALIPFGTCNDFAKVLGFRNFRFKKRKIDALLGNVAANHFSYFSIAKVNNHYFINNAGFGRKAPAAGEKRGAVQDLRRMQAVRIRMSCGSRQAENDYLMMVCANAPYFSNGLHFSADCDPADDRLEFFFVKDVSKIRLLGKLFLGKQGVSIKRKQDPSIEKIEASRLSLTSDAPIWIMADGETVPQLSGIREATFEMAGKVRFFSA